MTMRSDAILIVPFLIFGVFGYGFSDGNLRRHDELACEGYEIRLRCPGKDLINVKAAAYGRQDDMTCVVDSHEMQDIHCRLPNAKDFVAERCNGNTSCDFIVGSGVFQDPCPGTKKYLNVMYECVPFIIKCPGRLYSVSISSQTRTNLQDNAAWMKDPYQVSDKLYYMGYTKYLARQLYEYTTVDDMVGGSPEAFYDIRQRVDGTGFVVYDRNLFFTPEGTNKVSRFDLSSQSIEASKTLPSANFDGISPYAIGLNTDIDLAVDENGLWAIYATEYNEGNIVISRLKRHNLEIIGTWQTEYDKLSALNSFMVCGVLYVINADTLRIDYMFNTTSNIGTGINIRIPGLRRNISTVNYNPKEQKLYVWDKKSANTYSLNFAPIIVNPTTTRPPTTTTRLSTASTRSTTTRPRKTPTVGPPIIAPRPRCQSMEKGGMMWPDAYYGTVAKVRCPDSDYGNAFWVCGGNATHPRWVDESPDFTECVSEWIRQKQQELNDGADTAAKLSTQFTDSLRQQMDIGRRVTKWDIVKIVEMLRGFLDKATSERQGAGKLMGSVLMSASMLLHPDLEKSWNELSIEVQNLVASRLIEVVEDTAFFLAYDISVSISKSPNDRQNQLNWSEGMVSLGTRVDFIPPSSAALAETDYDKIIWITGQGDTVQLDTNAILRQEQGHLGASNADKAQNQTTTQHLAVVLLSFRNIGKYLKDKKLYSTYLQPVDSRVLSVSAAFITRTTTVPEDNEVSVIVNKHQTLNLARPLQMTLLRKNPTLNHHVCAFWDFGDRSSPGSWSRKGCYAVEQNSTHTVCQCNHMTSFALLSSNVPFPPMGNERNGPATTAVTVPVIQRDLPILRAGLSISLFFLVLVAATLIPLSASKRLQSDINTIHKNLVISLIATEVVFLCGIDRTMVPDVCGAVAGLLHFGLLATFTWAALEAYHLMVLLGDTIERQDRWRWYYAVGYGVPTVVVAVSAAADHTGYGTVAVCWLKTNGNFIWSFIAPCCFVILCCIVFLCIIMYRLHLYAATYSEAPKHKAVRSGVARSCALMFLLCALWSCGVLWLSNFQPRATAILFCILSSFYGIAAFFLHCILSSEVRKRYSACFSKVAKTSTSRTDGGPSRHRHLSNNSHSVRLGSSTSHGGTLRPDLISSYGGYYTTRTGCAATLLPVSAAQSTSLTIDQTRCASDMDITRVTHLENAPFTNQRGHSDGSGFDVTSEIDSRRPRSQQAHPGSEAGWSNHHYEQPLPHISNCSTIASGASGHYNHLHEHYPGGSHHHLVPVCPQAPSRCNHQRFNHHYETMDIPLCTECPTELGVQVQMDECGEPKAVHYRHCFDDSQHRNVALTAPIRRSRGHGNCHEGDGERRCSMQELDPDHHRYAQSHAPGNDDSQVPVAVNRGYLTHSAHPPSYPNAYSSRRGQIKMGTSGLSIAKDISQPQRRHKQNNYYGNRAGRSSDPLSTDQGYDTDSQQQGCRGCCDYQSDNDHSCSPRPPSLPKQTLVVRSVENPVLPPTTLITAAQPDGQNHKIIAPIPKRMNNPNRSKHRNSSSDLSECTSENDLEVERIIAANPDELTREAPHGDSGNFEDGDQNDESGQAVLGRRAETEEMIDTACGGRLSVAESVTSWCAHAGSNPRAVNSSYGNHNKGKGKKTADPNVILANARSRAENGESQQQGRNKKYVYTLPGTAAAGTKAKIDLKSGGISMVTNL